MRNSIIVYRKNKGINDMKTIVLTQQRGQNVCRHSTRRALGRRTPSRRRVLACIGVVGFVVFTGIRGWTVLGSALWPRFTPALVGIRLPALDPTIVFRAVCGLGTIVITEARNVVGIDIPSMTYSSIRDYN